MPQKGDDIQHIGQFIVIYDHYISDLAYVLIRKEISFRTVAIGLHEIRKFMRKGLFGHNVQNLYLPQMIINQ